MEKIEDVRDVHHIHIWSMDGFNNFATMHIVKDTTDINNLKNLVKDELKEHGISHTTIEIESLGQKCSEIEWYVNNEKEMYKCCGYSPLGKASIFIESINGDYNNLLGLSPNVMFSKLRNLEYSIMDFEYTNKK